MYRQGKSTEKYVAHVKIGDFYNFYKNNYFSETLPSGETKVYTKGRFFLSKSDYSKIVGEFNLKIRELMLYKSFDFMLPCRMGVLGVRKYKPKCTIDENGNLINKLPPDWNETIKLWESNPEAKANKVLVRHKNKHSNGYVMRLKYMKAYANYKWSSAYTFLPCRTVFKTLTTILKDEDNTIDYFKV